MSYSIFILKKVRLIRGRQYRISHDIFIREANNFWKSSNIDRYSSLRIIYSSLRKHVLTSSGTLLANHHPLRRVLKYYCTYNYKYEPNSTVDVITAITTMTFFRIILVRSLNQYRLFSYFRRRGACPLIGAIYWCWIFLQRRYFHCIERPTTPASSNKRHDHHCQE